MFQKGSFDTKKRAAIGAEMTMTMRKLKYAGEGFEVLIAPGEEGIMALVIEDVMRANPDFALVAWPSGPAIVRRKDIDAINADFRKVNESTGFVTSGGADFDIESIDPKPLAASSGGRVKDGDYGKAMPDAYEKYDQHPALKKE